DPRSTKVAVTAWTILALVVRITLVRPSESRAEANGQSGRNAALVRRRGDVQEGARGHHGAAADPEDRRQQGQALGVVTLTHAGGPAAIRIVGAAEPLGVGVLLGGHVEEYPAGDRRRGSYTEGDDAPGLLAARAGRRLRRSRRCCAGRRSPIDGLGSRSGT